MDKIWEIAPRIPENFKEKFPEINPVVLQLLYNRDLQTQKEIDEFLLPDYSQDIHDPFIFQDMERAVARIYQAIKNKEKILIYGDYDTDGVTATTVLHNTFKKLGAENLSTYLPDRDKEGYGLNKKAIKDFIKQKINLIVTCDCGVTNVDEIDLANQSGIDVIVTDHHLEPSKLPKAYAIINPKLSREKYPFRYLAGVGVAFKLVQAMLSRLPKEQQDFSNPEAFEKWLLDLVAIGTIADLMPILGENRTLVKYGLVVLNKTQNLGLRYLIEKASFIPGSMDAYRVAYQISPRLNAAGRMGHANDALGLLLADKGGDARELADKLNFLNESRQKEMDKIIENLKKNLGENPEEKILLVAGEDWKIGVLGIIAGKLANFYHRPALAFSQKKDRVKASGRAPSFFNLFEVLNKLKKYFLDFGGHPGAAGFTLKNPADFKKFKKDFLKIVEDKLNPEDFRAKTKIDAEIDLKSVDWDLEENLEKFQPFGRDNPQPNFLLKGVNLKNITVVGRNGTHRRLVIDDNRKMIYFSCNHRIADLKIGDKIDVVFQLSVNQWNGRRELQMKVVDIRKHEPR